ncbi:hypothetical protein [Reinekea marinisedimentorum]|uniref:Lipoprotein n=1 Tax=Reinekea marinisedimentorum TaxID=230495 RepID=A0A4R3HTV5_9GAMM|nr:hypothetical protein [Reinekea marinisedimentorum]TCS36124.1 hypothetical protein BCF53_1275 [Reinekea marinisedimentorum]
MQKAKLIKLAVIVASTLALNGCMLFASPTPVPAAAVVTVPAVVPAPH